MKINWKVRFSNPNFWLSLIPALFLLIQVCAAPFGYNWDFSILNQQIAAIINAAFGLLSLLSIVTDPTTAGVGDRFRAMSYTTPTRE